MADESSTSANNETVTLRLKSGEMVDVVVPSGLSDEGVKSYAQMKRPDLFGAPAGGVSGIKSPVAPPMEGSAWGKSDAGEEALPPGKIPSSILNKPADWTDDAIGASALGGATVLGGEAAAPTLLQLMRAHPKISSMAAIEAAHYLPGAVGRLARQIPSWTGMMATGQSEPPTLDSETGEVIEGAQPRLKDLMLSGETAPPTAPSGRFVLSPEEAAAQDQQMRLAQRMASQRGMQYAAGMKPQPNQ